MKELPFTGLKDWAYVNAETGEILERFTTRQFYEWNDKLAYGPGFELIREYLVDREAQLNPEFKE